MKKILLALALVATLLAPAHATDRAFYLVQGHDLRNPVNVLAGHSVLICNSALDVDTVRKLADPGATLFAYVNSRSVPTYGENSEHYQSLRAAMADDSFYFLRDDGERVTAVGYEKLQVLRPNLAAYTNLAVWIGEKLSEWDGIYLDDHFAVLPARNIEQRGVEEAELERLRFAAAMDFFVEAIRTQLPEDKIVIGNIGGGWPPPSNLDAITIEAGHVRRMGYAIALWRFYDWSRMEGHLGQFNIAWELEFYAPEVVIPGTIR